MINKVFIFLLFSLYLHAGFNFKPIAKFDYVANKNFVTFYNKSYDTDGKIKSVSWEFGDGNYCNSSSSMIVHKYERKNSEYVVRLIVEDDKNEQMSYSVRIPIIVDMESANSNGVQNGKISTSDIDFAYFAIGKDDNLTNQNYQYKVILMDTSKDIQTIRERIWVFGEKILYNDYLEKSSLFSGDFKIDFTITSTKLEAIDVSFQSAGQKQITLGIFYNDGTKKIITKTIN
ncbi:MAG: PKD domain-containing protein, partial [Campylobacterales bacterium]|nr:PKD domain-containing protein [Campylobacterales bacterium]